MIQKYTNMPVELYNFSMNNIVLKESLFNYRRALHKMYMFKYKKETIKMKEEKNSIY